MISIYARINFENTQNTEKNSKILTKNKMRNKIKDFDNNFG